MTEDPYTQTVQALLDLGGQRVWSLMVTLFGDLAQAEGTTIDGPVLSALMAAMDIRPEAVRVALHRLRNDGWIASEKLGRTRRHALTATSRAESARASTRIYAAPGTAPEGWSVALLETPSAPPPEEMAQRGYAPLMPRVYIGGAQARPPDGALALTGGAAPDWLRQQTGAALPGAEYAQLLPILRRADTQLDPQDLSALQQAVIRCLIVHSWRRIVLRHPDLPPALLPADWPGAACHRHVHRLLTRIPRPPLDAILAP